MESGTFQFEEFELDPAERQLRRGGEPVELSGRYLDALELLVREQGRLVTKNRFMDEVWRGIPVTDEALTQCVRTLRKQLGDEAGRPRFIETVPKHGYRFIAPVGGSKQRAGQPAVSAGTRNAALLAAAGTIGGAAAGLIGGLFYGFAASGAGVGSASTVLALVSVTLLVAIAGAAGVSGGIAAATLLSGAIGRWSAIGGAAGGLVVGAAVKLVGVDAIDLLFGQPPAGVTGAGEGALLGGAVGLGAWLAARGGVFLPLRLAASLAALAGAAAGLAIALAGGRLMVGSLQLIARTFPSSRLRLDQLGALFGEGAFGSISQTLMTVAEGALFAACVVGAMVMAQKRLGLER